MMNNATPTISLHRAGGRNMVLGTAGGAAPVKLLHGATGFGAAPVSFASSPRLGGHGSILRGSRLNEREIFIPVLAEAPTMSELNDVRNDLVSFLSPLDKRELTLRVSVAGRPWREIPVHYAGGLDGDFGGDYHGHWQKIGLEFRAFDGLWRGEPRSVSRQADPAVKPFLSDTEDFFPVMLAGSTVAAQIEVNIAGDAPTHPLWTITPPGADLTIRNISTGDRFYLDGLLTETVKINMGTGQVTSESFPNGELWDRVSIDSRVFQLSPGKNVLDFSMVGSTADSMIHITYQPTYLAGY